MTPEEVEVKEILDGRPHRSLDLAYDEAKRIVDAQFSHTDALEVKASILLGFGGVLFTLLLTVLPGEIRYYDFGTYLLLFALYIATVSSVVCAFIAIHPRHYQNVPSIHRMLEMYLEWEEANAKFQLLYALRDVYDENEKANGKKLIFIKRSLWSLELCGFLGFLIFAYQVWFH